MPVLVDVLEVIGAACSVSVSVAAYISLQRARHLDSGTGRRAETAEIVRAGTEDMRTSVRDLENLRAEIRELGKSLDRIDLQGTQEINGVISRVAVLEAKVEVFWRNVAMGAAAVLHSPHKERAELDRLLEKYMRGSMSASDRRDLAHHLSLIAGANPPDVVMGKRVTPGDQIAAIIVLKVLEMDQR